MDLLQQYVMAGFVLVGFVNGLGLAFDHNWKSFGLFSIAVLTGTVFGLLKWFMIPSAEIGFAIGIASSGVYKTAQKIGGV